MADALVETQLRQADELYKKQEAEAVASAAKYLALSDKGLADFMAQSEATTKAVSLLFSEHSSAHAKGLVANAEDLTAFRVAMESEQAARRIKLDLRAASELADFNIKIASLDASYEKAVEKINNDYDASIELADKTFADIFTHSPAFLGHLPMGDQDSVLEGVSAVADS